MSRAIESDGRRARRFDGFFINPGDVIVDHSQNARWKGPSEDDPALIQLAHSIINRGQLQPCSIRPVGGGKYQLFVGYRRHAAMTLANKWLVAEGKEPLKLKCVAWDTNAEQSFEAAIDENEVRRNHSPMDVAKIITTLRERYGKTTVEIAQRFHNRDGKPMSESWVSQMEALMRLETPLQAEVHAGNLSVADASLLLSITEENRLTAYELGKALKDEESQNGNHRTVQIINGKPVARTPRMGKSVGEIHLRKAAEEMGEKLGGTIRMAEFRHTLELEDNAANPQKVRAFMRATNKYLQRNLTEKQWVEALEKA